MKWLRIFLALVMCVNMTAFSACAFEFVIDGSGKDDFNLAEDNRYDTFIPSNEEGDPNSSDPPKRVINGGVPLFPEPEVFGLINLSNIYPMDTVLRTGSLYTSSSSFPEVDVLVSGLLVAERLPDWIDPAEVGSLTTKRTGDTDEEWLEFCRESFPLGEYYVFVTFRVTNPSQETILTNAMIQCADVYMVDNANHTRLRVNYVYDHLVYQSYDDGYPPDYLFPSTSWPFLKLLPGETREVVIGYLVDRRWLDDPNGTWRYFVGLHTRGSTSGITPLNAQGWLIDDDKITYLDIE